MNRTSHSYFVVMVDYGKGPQRPMGLEAVVNPEFTRRDIVHQLAHGEWKHVAFIHHVDGLFVEDVTNELFDEAEAIARETVSPWVREVQAMDRAAQAAE